MTTRRSSGMSRQEAGRKGAEARWGKSSSSSERRGNSRSSQDHTSRQEAGQKGGRTVSEEYGPQFYQEIGRRGGRERWGEEERGYSGERGGSQAQHQRAGRAGAAARWGRNYDENEDDGHQEAGHKGGKATSAKYGREFYQEIGRKGGHAHRGSKQFE